MAKEGPQNRANGQSPAKESARDEFVVVPLVREFPSGLMGVLANQMVVLDDGAEFHLLFFQTHPPIILGDTEEEIKKAVHEVKSVPSTCVARVIISAERFPSFVRAMIDNLEKHERKKQDAGGSADQKRKGA